MTTYEQVHALVRAHVERDEERFSRTVGQIAARLTGQKQRRLLQLANATPRTLEMLPIDVRGVVYEPPINDTELALPDRLYAELDSIVDEWSATGELLEAGLRPRSRLLFCGPPGNGKTTAAAQLARKLRLNVYVCSIAETVGSHMGETGRNIDKALGVLRAGHALILDELDALGSTRHASGDAAGREANRAISSLLTALDRYSTGLLIATTNRRDMLDPALVRRFDESLEFPAPDSATLSGFMWRLSHSFGIAPGPDECGIESYDAATKAVHKAARKAIVASKAEAAE